MLVEQLAEELGPRWKEAAARRLKITGAYVGMIHGGTRHAADDVIQRAMDPDGLGMSYRFFYDEELGERPNYREHQTKGPEAIWREFLRNYKHLDFFTEESLAAFRKYWARNAKVKIKTWQDWARIADMTRELADSSHFEVARGKK